MNILIKNIPEHSCACDALVLPFSEGASSAYAGTTRSLLALIRKMFKKDFHGRENEQVLVPAPDDCAAAWVLLIGLGNSRHLTADKLRQAGGKALTLLRERGARHVAISTSILNSREYSTADFLEGALLALYSFKRYRRKPDETIINKITVLSSSSGDLREKLRRTRAVTDAVYFTRDLINTPSNDMTPTDLAKAAMSLRKKRLSVKVLGKQDIRKLGMGAFLAVARGSHEDPQFIILEYKGSDTPPLALVGKSITFDSGGISLKPADGMEKMKYDMAGGAAVLGIIKAASELRLPMYLVGILPATENLPGGSATKPGDIVRSLDGKTVEIINTDAEGRLILADAITYVKRFKPRAIIDIATLTGACPIALGNEAIAAMGNDKTLIKALCTSGKHVNEKVWEMPLFEELKDYLKSDIADIKNTGGKNGALLTSAYFLYEFAGQTPWVHLDIAGTAWSEKDRPYVPKGATAVGVRLILDMIKRFK